MSGALAGAVLVSCALVGGCRESRSDLRWFPLDVGRVWQYRVERTTMDGTRSLRHVVLSVPAPPDSGLAGARRTLDGRELRYMREAGGLFRVAPDGGQELLLPTAPSPGVAWQASTTTAVLENTGPPWETLFRIRVPVVVQHQVVSDAASISTPAGRFDGCLLVTGLGSTSADVGNYVGRVSITVETREWYAPGIGLVRLERDERTSAAALNAGRLVVELDSWRRR